MNTDFQALYEEKDKEAFDIWDVKAPTPEPLPEIDEAAEFAKECERLREEAKQAGYREGCEQAAVELRQKHEELAQWLHLLQHPLSLLDKALTEEMVQTILWICEHCIQIELACHPEKIAAIIDEIKKELPSLQAEKQLAMHPLDLEFIQKELEEQKELALSTFLLADEQLSRGDFYLKTEYNELDGRIKTRLQTLFKTYLCQDSVKPNSE